MAFGALKGTVLSVAANSITATTSATGSQAVVAGDLIYAVIAEQAGASVTACGDNLGNTYTPTSAAADAGTICTGRAFWFRVTTPGTLTSVNFTCTGTTNNVVALAAVIEGPFAASPLDANPANTINDNTTPYAGPPTGTLAQASEAVLCWIVHNGAPTFTATAPNVVTTQLATQTILKLAIGRQVVAATTTVTPAWTSSAVPTQSCYGTTSFKAETAKTLTASAGAYAVTGQAAGFGYVFANVQGGEHQNGSPSSATVAVTLGATVGVGNMLCVSVGAISDLTESCTVADDQGNTYTPVDTVRHAGQNYAWRTFYRLNITNAPQTITATFNLGRQFGVIIVDEFSGVATSSALDGHTMQAQSGIAAGTGVTSGNCTTTVNGNLVYGTTVNVTGSGTVTKGTSFTQGGVNVANAFNTEYLRQSAASASTAATYTHSATDTFITGVMAFKAAAVGVYVLPAATSSYAVSGQAAGLTYVPAPPEQVLGGGFVPFGSAPWGGAQVLAQEYSLTADAGAYAVTGQPATLRQGHVVVASAGAYAVTGQAATLRQANVLTAATGAYSVSGQPATAKHGSLITASAGSYAVTGQAAAFVQGSNIIAAAGAYAVTGQPATLRRTRLLAAGAGAYSVTGNAAGFAYEAADAYVITGLPGVYAVTGQAADLHYASLLTAAAGSYSVTGQAATLRQTSVVTAAAGAYAVTGQAAGLRTASVLVASAGAYAVAGQSATLRQGHVVAAQAGAYAVSGQAATLAKGHLLAASAGAYAVTGQPASLTWQAVGVYVLAGQAGAYAVTGQPATLLTASVLVAASGSYAVTGQAATLRYDALGPPIEPPIFGGGVSKPLVRRELVARIESTQQPQFARLVGGVSVPAKVRSLEWAQANDAQLGLLVIGELVTRQTQMVREGVLWQAMMCSAYAGQDRQTGNGELQLILDMNIKSGLERTQVPQYTGEPMAKIFVASDPAWSKKKAA